MNKENKDQVVIYEGKDGKVELRADIKKDTIWATQVQIADVFQTTKQNIGQHIKNVFSTKELEQSSVVKDFFTTAVDGKKYKVQYYNLDVIIAVGYRINSKKATQFRIWATRTLREYLVAGYSLNHHRLENHPETMPGLYEAVSLLKSKDTSGRLKGKIIFKMTQDLIP